MINWALIVLAGLAGFIIGIFFFAFIELFCSLRRDVKELLEESKKKGVKNDKTGEKYGK